jgi:hypothetical protein
MRYRPRRRSGLTLLEIVLTFAIAMLVLLALVMIMHSQFSNAQAGRDALTEATVARSILTRLSADIGNSLGGVDPRFLSNNTLPNNVNQSPDGVANLTAAALANATAGASGTSTTPNASSSSGASPSGASSSGASSSGASSSGASSSGASSSGASSSGASSSGASSSGASSSGSSSSSSSSTGTTPLPYNLGVKGDAKWLILSTNRAPGALLVSPKAPITDDSIPSPDLRCLSLWLVDGKGLARNEMAAVTADNAPTDVPTFDNPQQYVFAKEVVDVLFEYYDGATWQPNWDGGALGGNDGNTPIGPPAAIRVTIWLQSGPAIDGGDPTTVAYKHVVALPTSNAYSVAGPGINSGNFLVPTIQAGQQIPAANAPATTTSGSGM